MLKIQKKNVLKIYNLPKDVKFCTNCVASNQRPRVSFNKDNLCNACVTIEINQKLIGLIERKN